MRVVVFLFAILSPPRWAKDLLLLQSTIQRPYEKHPLLLYNSDSSSGVSVAAFGGLVRGVGKVERILGHRHLR